MLRSYLLTRLIKNVNEYAVLPKPVSADIPKGTEFEKYLVISDQEDKASKNTTKQLTRVLDYMKKKYSSIDVNDKPPSELDFDCIFLSFERLDFLENLEKFLSYVEIL